MRGILVGLLTASLLGVIPATTAHADCAYDPDALSFREMIAKDKTGQPGFPVMFLGKVVSVKDKGKPGGQASATLAVAAHPVGNAPLVSRVQFYKPPPGTWVEDNLEFHPTHRYVVIAKHHGGSFVYDGGCGQSRKVGKTKFHNLVKDAQRPLGTRWVRQQLLV